MSTGKTVTWTRTLYLALIKAHEEAAAARQAAFTLDLGKGDEVQFDAGYAKHVIEYLAPHFAAPDQPRRPYNEGEEGQ